MPFGRGHEVPRVVIRCTRSGAWDRVRSGRSVRVIRPSRAAGGPRREASAVGGMSAFEQTGSVPSRRRSKSSKPEPRDPVEQFGALLRESAERERAAQDRIRLERQRARDTAASAAAHAAALDAARRKLADAIRDVREARRAGSGVAAADEAWRQAKARLIELETGAPPSGRVTTPPTHRRATTAPTLPRRSLGSSSRSRSTQRCRSERAQRRRGASFGRVVRARRSVRRPREGACRSTTEATVATPSVGATERRVRALPRFFCKHRRPSRARSGAIECRRSRT